MIDNVLKGRFFDRAADERPYGPKECHAKFTCHMACSYVHGLRHFIRHSHLTSSCFQIMMLTNHPKSSKHPNIHEVTHGLPYFREDGKNMFEVRKQSKMGGLQLFVDSLPLIARDMYQVPEVKELYERRKEFDLIVVNHMFNEVSDIQQALVQD